MKYFVIFLILIGFVGSAFASESDIPPPLKQMKLGIKLGHIICDEDKNQTWNIHFKPACVFPDSEFKLMQRGWAKLRLMMPASADPIKELEIMGQNELSYRFTGNLIVGDEKHPLSYDRKRELAWEYSQKYHPGERFLEYSIPTSGMYHYNVGDKIQFDLLEWGNYSECWNLRLRIIDIHDQPVYEDSSVRFCLEPMTNGQPGWFASYSTGEEFEEFVCDKAGYYRIEVSNGEIFSPTILQNFACLNKSKSVSLIEQFKDIPEVKAFYAKYPDTYEEVRSDHVSYVAGSDDGFKVRMNLYFDEYYNLDYINLKCYWERQLQDDVAGHFIQKYLKGYECEKND